MLDRRKSIEPSLREKIISESNEVGCVITNLAAKYGITAEMIYAWRSRRNKMNHGSKKRRSEKSDNNFVEWGVI